jgi:hypothetical protein
MDLLAAQGNDGLAALRAAVAAPAPAPPSVDCGDVAAAASPRPAKPRPREETDAEVERARDWLLGGAPTLQRAAVDCLQRAEAAGNPVAGYWLAWVALGSVLLPRDGRINERMLLAVHRLGAAVRQPARRRQPGCLRPARRGDGRARRAVAGHAVAARGALPRGLTRAAVTRRMQRRSHEKHTQPYPAIGLDYRPCGRRITSAAQANPKRFNYLPKTVGVTR